MKRTLVVRATKSNVTQVQVYNWKKIAKKDPFGVETNKKQVLKNALAERPDLIGTYCGRISAIKELFRTRRQTASN